MRLQYIDALKSLAIFLVLWGHCILSLSGREATADPVFAFINSFHMPLFMMMVGFFSSSSLKRSFSEFVIGKFRALIFPTIVWVIAFWILNGIIFEFDSYAGWDGFKRNLVGSMWFLKSAFCCYLLYYCTNKPLIRLKHSVLIGGVISILLSQLFPVFKVNSMFPCFFTGVLVARYLPAIIRRWKETCALSAAVFVFSYTVLFDESMFGMMPVIKQRLLQFDFSALHDLALLQI